MTKLFLRAAAGINSILTRVLPELFLRISSEQLLSAGARIIGPPPSAAKKNAEVAIFFPGLRIKNYAPCDELLRYCAF